MIFRIGRDEIDLSRMVLREKKLRECEKPAGTCKSCEVEQGWYASDVGVLLAVIERLMAERPSNERLSWEYSGAVTTSAGR